MKTMKQMQDEMWNTAARERQHNGTDYPKVIPLFPGIACYVHSKEEEDAMERRDAIAVFCFVGVNLIALGFFVSVMIWS